MNSEITLALAVRSPHIKRMEKSEPRQRSARLAMWARPDRTLSAVWRGPAVHALSEVAERCDHCGMAFHHHRADDLPGYLVLFIVGPIVVGSMLVVESYAETSIWI